MLQAARSFTDDLDSKEIVYKISETNGGEVIIAVPFKGKETHFIFAGPDGRYVSMYTVFETVPERLISETPALCNDLNRDHRWFKFYLDKGHDLMIQDDEIVDPEKAGEECFDLLIRLLGIIDDVRSMIVARFHHGW